LVTYNRCVENDEVQSQEEEVTIRRTKEYEEHKRTDS